MSYLIPSFFLNIEEENLEDLRGDIWNNDPVPAYLKVEDVTYDVDIAYRGSYTRKFRKRSYRIEFIDPKTFSGAREIHLNAEYKDPLLSAINFLSISSMTLVFYHHKVNI